MLRALVVVTLMVGNLVLWGTPVLLGGLVKLVTFGETRRRVSRALVRLAERFVDGNDWICDTFLDTVWDIQGVEDLSRDKHYLVISNHVSWIDILAAFRAFQRRTPLIRFFLKKELIWFPIVGQGCWALGYPFMQRYTADYLARHPEKRGRDLETTRKMCERFRRVPVAILNFLEGTRFSRDKQEEQDSPYRNLLRPHTGGAGFVLASLGDQLEAIVDLTIAYPDRDTTMWDLITNRISRVAIRARTLPIPPEFCTPAITEPGPVRDAFRSWVDEIWREKDDLIERLRQSGSAAQRLSGTGERADDGASRR